MTAFTNLAEDDFLDLFFTNAAFPNVGDAGGLQPSAAAGSLYVSGHTAALAETHTAQTQSECAYTGYGRAAVARSTAGWTVSAGVCDNDAIISLGEKTGGANETITDVGIGFASSGAGVLQLYGTVTSSLLVADGVEPQYAAGALDISIT